KATRGFRRIRDADVGGGAAQSAVPRSAPPEISRSALLLQRDARHRDAGGKRSRRTAALVAGRVSARGPRQDESGECPQERHWHARDATAGRGATALRAAVGEV